MRLLLALVVYDGAALTAAVTRGGHLCGDISSNVVVTAEGRTCELGVVMRWLLLQALGMYNGAAFATIAAAGGKPSELRGDVSRHA